jgi:hypothetical protein
MASKRGEVEIECAHRKEGDLNRQAKKKSASKRSAKLPSRQNRNSWGKDFVIITVFIALAVRLFLLISRFAVNLFFSDQWDFNNATLFEKHSLWEMFRWQHGPHRQGLGAIISYFVEPFFRWNSRTESFLVGIIIVLAAICALWLKRRLFGAFDFSDVCIPLIFFVPSQYETLFATANLAHGPVPLLLILLYCISWTIPKPLPRYSFVILLNFGAIYTGFGLFLGVITPIALVADYYLNQIHLKTGKIYLFASLVLSLASIGSFFVHYTFTSSANCPPNLFKSPLVFVQFLCALFARSLGVFWVDVLQEDNLQVNGFQIVIGAVIVIAMAAALVMSCRRFILKEQTASPRNMIAAILISYCLLFGLNASYGRSCTGAMSALESRYVIYMGLGLLGLYFCFLTIHKTRLRWFLLILLTAALIGTIPIRPPDERLMTIVSNAKRYWRQCYLETSDINQCYQSVTGLIYPDPENTHMKTKLDFLKKTKQNLYADVP